MLTPQETLEFQCVCSNGTTANLEPYTTTIPFFVCEENYKQCIEASNHNLDAQEKCKQAREENCGTIPPKKVSDSSTTTSSMQSTMATMTSTPTMTKDSASSSSASTAATTTAGNAAMALAPEQATGLMGAALFFALRMVL